MWTVLYKPTAHRVPSIKVPVLNQKRLFNELSRGFSSQDQGREGGNGVWRSPNSTVSQKRWLWCGFQLQESPLGALQTFLTASKLFTFLLTKVYLGLQERGGWENKLPQHCLLWRASLLKLPGNKDSFEQHFQCPEHGLKKQLDSGFFWLA